MSVKCKTNRALDRQLARKIWQVWFAASWVHRIASRSARLNLS